MVTVTKLSNFPDELRENDELREFELSRADCNRGKASFSTFLCYCPKSRFNQETSLFTISQIAHHEPSMYI